LWAGLSGILVPIIIILVGVIAVILNSEMRGLTSPMVKLGAYLLVPVRPGFVLQSPLLQLAEFVGITLAVCVLVCLAMWFHRRDADERARAVIRSLHAKLLKQSLRRAELEGAAAQHARASKLIDEDLPRMQEALSKYFCHIPRSVLVLAGCITVALLVNVWLSVLAVVSCALMWQFYLWLHDTEAEDLMNWEVPRSRRRMAELVGQAPMLARLQSQGLADRAFDLELETLYRRLASDDYRQGRIWPLLFLAASVAIAVLVMGLGVSLLYDDAGISLPAALVLGLSLTCAVVSLDRLLGLMDQSRAIRDSCSEVYHYLQRSSDVTPSEQRVGLTRVRDCVEIRDVSLGDSQDKPILSHLSLKLTPGSMVSVLGTDSVSTRALTELLMGFGRPVGGVVLIDGIRLLDVHPQALARNVMWIEPSGPIWDGTVFENVQGGQTVMDQRDVVEALEAVGIYERLQRLPEGLSTILAAEDEMLDDESRYAIGIARALIHKPPILLVSESIAPTEHLVDDPCLTSLRKLVDSGTLVVMLPRRLQTLRSSDRVVLLNGPRLVGEGKHADLLGGSDLYRHLNYLLFNPYRHQHSP
jgi:ABC-type multidrug transport system fused ATPase/permease subunit